MRFGSVCSGIEAASAAWHGLGWRAAWVSEIEAFPSAVIAARWPGVENLGDMTALPERILAREVEAPDILVGGTPCQAFSVAGLRGSLSDARGNLTLTFVRIADAIDAVRRADGRAPCWVVWENVPGVLSVADNAFGAFLGGLVGGDAALDPPRGRGWTDAGVVSGPSRCAAWRVLDAQHFGLAQRRRRVFVLARGGAGSWAAADALLPVIESVRWHPAPRRASRERTAPTLAARTRGGGGLGTDAELDGALIPLGLGEDGQLARALNACHTASGRHDVSVDTFVAHSLRGEGFDASEDGTGRRTPLVPVAQPYTLAIRGRGETHNLEYRQDGTANALLTPNGGRGGIGVGAIAHAFDARQSDVIQYGDRTGLLDTDGHSVAVAFTQNQRDEVREVGVVGALAAEPGMKQQTYLAVAPTLTAANDPSRSPQSSEVQQQVAAVHATTMQVRRLTPRECERLQGFPDGYTAIPWRGKPASECPDGPRYKALGNSMAVPVMRYLGERIAAVESER